MLVVVCAVLGAGAVIVPTVALSETSPTIIAENHPGLEETHNWAPATATVSENGVVTFENSSSEVPHGIEWRSTPGEVRPTCESTVPVGVGFTKEDAKTEWKGKCTFTTPGAYVFYCTVHGPEMTGTVTVNSNGTTTTTMTMPTTTTSPTSTTPGLTPPPTTGASPSTGGSPLAGSASSAIKLASSQHGASVHGTVAVSAAGAGGHLLVELLAKRASLASAAASKVQVGRTSHASLHAGTVPFTVALSAKAKRALHSRHRLSLSVEIVLTPAHGAAVSVTRSVVLHA